MLKITKKSYHPQLGDKMILKRVKKAFQKNISEFTFKIILAKKQYKIIINPSPDENHEIFKTPEGQEFCIFEIAFEKESP